MNRRGFLGALLAPIATKKRLTLTIHGVPYGVNGFEFSDPDLAFSMEEFQRKYILPRMMRVDNEMDAWFLEYATRDRKL